MGNQEQDSATRAAAGMRHLRQELTAMRPRHVGSTRRATRAHAEPPCDLDLLDHLTATRSDLIETTRILLSGETNPPPQAIPHPLADEGIFQWSVDATAHLSAEKQQALEAVTYTKLLEQKLLTGDRRVINRHRCPGCRCLSLLWREHLQRAVCVQDECRDQLGRATQWELKQVAHHHVMSRPQRAAN
ncbi:hypothetical protein [Streptomyces decoyicus]